MANQKVEYYLSENSSPTEKHSPFIIENFHQAPPFTSFLPGIAGLYGCQLWAFYVNRGQRITSFGVEDKSGAIMEFEPANKSYRQTELTGFRTFIKVDGEYFEPFRNCCDCASSDAVKREMQIRPEALKIVETNSDHKLKIEVEYYVLPEETFPALVRNVKITNLSKKPRQIELLDGMPIIIPLGFNDDLLKRITRTTEAWCRADNLENNAPLFRLKVFPSDSSVTTLVKSGHFYLTTGVEAGYVVDPSLVFGEHTALEIPEKFLAKKFVVPEKQIEQGYTPSAFTHLKKKFKDQIEFNTLIGRVDTVEELAKIKEKIQAKNYFADKREEAKGVIENLTDLMSCETNEPLFDQYSRYSFMDNVMRGGLPVTLGGATLYAYSRKHGDPERDYNDFKLSPTYFSQGNGNYRDVNQNRRSDLFFNPELMAENIYTFFNLTQLDGFNPLIMLAVKYSIDSAEKAEKILRKHLNLSLPHLAKRLTEPFLLGEVMKELDRVASAKISAKNPKSAWITSREAFAEELLSQATAQTEAVHGEGYWADHFSYNLDLLESFESIYPDKIIEVLFKKNCTFFDNDHIVVPRKYKYVLDGEKVRQFKSVRTDSEKVALISERKTDKNIVRTLNGKGEIYKTTLLAKLLSIIANKAASFDAEGIGLELEADKPDWYDALNGLPSLFGSSVSETLELKRLAEYTLGKISVSRSAEVINLPEELFEFIAESGNYLDKWEASYHLKEVYREKIRLGVTGIEKPLTREMAMTYLSKVIVKCSLAVKKMLAKYGNYCTYFINEPVAFDGDKDGIRIRQFKQIPLPLFLEGFVHALKVEKDSRIHSNVKHSPLYDKKLGMYKVNASLEKMPIEIGRTKVFAAGWLENESIWLHMQYKYLLELLKTGLLKEFFEEFKTAAIPFQDPARYKRSILENSSFIVSGANARVEDHGRGFVARLSGASAEFIQMWITMFTGGKPFSLDQQGRLQFQLSPILPKGFFKSGKVSFKLLGSIDVTYINKKGQDTFGEKALKPVSYQLTFTDGHEEEVAASILSEIYAQAIRERKVSKIIVTLG